VNWTRPCSSPSARPTPRSWHSGKDLLAALAPQIHTQHRIDPKTFCRRLRDWIRDHPASVFEQLPEWAELFRCIAAET
jgi:hypothetical protein